jgi:glycosyltransferase involved in cell wall biosynthesis
MRILQLAQKPQRRGAEVFAYQLTRALRAQGHDTLLVFLYPYEGPAPLSHGADNVLRGNERSLLEKAPGVDPSLLRRLLHTIDDFRPDIVQANGARTLKYSAIAAIAGRKRTWTLVYRNIGDPHRWVATPLHTFFYRRLVMPQVDGIVGVSQTTLDAVRDFYSLSIPMVHIPRGIDPADLAPTRNADDVRAALGRTASDRILLYVGSLSQEKRVDRVLKALPELRQDFPSLYFWIVGDGLQRAQLHALSVELGLSNAIQFLGAQERVGDYLHAADLFVLTSDTEGMPGVLLEAGYAGLPVVATDVGGVAECVLDSETGILVAPQEEAVLAQALAAAVAQLLRNPAQRAEMGESAHDFVSDAFTIDRVSARYVEFYRILRKELLPQPPHKP